MKGICATAVAAAFLAGSFLVAGPAPAQTISMCDVPAGTFVMGRRSDGDDVYGGSEEDPQHSVTLDAYQIGKYEVTNAEYVTVLNWAHLQGYLRGQSYTTYTSGDVYSMGNELLLALSDPACQIDYSGGTFSVKTRETHSMADYPVICVTWYGAAAFCNWLSQKNGLNPCYNLVWGLTVPYTNGYRLPTEAEWERAAAWDTSLSKHWIYGFTSDTTNFPYRCNRVDIVPEPDVYANPIGFSASPYTSPVGYYDGRAGTIDSKSPVGCYDMSGNVWEWCHDWADSYDPSGNAETNPTGPASSTGIRIIRGGGYDDGANSVRTANRFWSLPVGGYDFVGFRVAKRAEACPSVVESEVVGTGLPTAATVDFAIEFSTPVTGVDADLSDFALGVVATGTAIRVPSLVPGSLSTTDNQTYIVTVDTGEFEGTLKVNVFDEGDIRDGSSVLLCGPYSSGEVHVVDTVAPKAIELNAITASPTNATAIAFNVEFSEEVAGFAGSGDTELNVTAVGVTYSSVSIVQNGGTADRYTVTFNSVDGDGSLTFDVATTGAVTDLAGNGLAAATDTNDTVVVDTVAPAVASIALDSANPSTGGSVVFTVTFDQDVLGFANEQDVTVIKDAGVTYAAAIAVAQTTGPDVYTVTLANVAGQGNLSIKVATVSPANVRDSVGNVLVDGPANVSPVVAVDSEGPPAPVLDPEPARTPGYDNTVAWSASAGAVSYTVECHADSSWTTLVASATVTGPPLSHTFTGLLDGRTYWYRVRAVDALANPSLWSVPAFSTQDATRPTFTIIAADPPVAAVGTSVSITFTASETLASNPSVTVNSHPATYVTGKAIDYVYAYTIQAADPEEPAIIEISGVDLAGNTGSAVDTGALSVDNTVPPPVPLRYGIAVLALLVAAGYRFRRRSLRNR